MTIDGRWSVGSRRAAALVVAGLLVAGCGKESEPRAAALDADMIRAQVESYFVDGKTLTAQQTLAPLVSLGVAVGTPPRIACGRPTTT